MWPFFVNDRSQYFLFCRLASHIPAAPTNLNGSDLCLFVKPARIYLLLNSLFNKEVFSVCINILAEIFSGKLV